MTEVQKSFRDLFIASCLMIDAQDSMSGNDLGAEARAQAWIKFRQAVEKINELSSKEILFPNQDDPDQDYPASI